MVADDDALDFRGDQYLPRPYTLEDVIAGEATMVSVTYAARRIDAAEDGGYFGAGLNIHNVTVMVSPDADMEALVRAIAEQVPPERMRRMRRITCHPRLIVGGEPVPDYRSAMPAMSLGESIDYGYVFYLYSRGDVHDPMIQERRRWFQLAGIRLELN
jgi:hypothetical protein